jgi:uncharacterized membrane protein YkvA (DUF1232 family)
MEKQPIKKERDSRDTLVMIIMAISVIYLIYPSWGVFEIIPDAIPIIGSIDEGVATTLLLSGLSYFGYNLTDLFKRKK